MRAAPTVFVACLCLLGHGLPNAQPNEAHSATAIVSRIPRVPVNSTAIAAIGYSRRLHALEVEFINGAIYRYLEVPPSLHSALMAANSKAQFYDRHIRGKYRSLHVRPQDRK